MPPLKVITRQLTPQEMAELAGQFEGWDTLKSHYPGVPDGGLYSIR